MLKYVGAILGFFLFLICLIYYAARPVGTLGFNVTNSYATNNGYMIVGSLQNKSRSSLVLRATNDQPEITMHIQIAPSSFQAGTPPMAHYSKSLQAGEKLAYEVFVPTNAPVVLMTHFMAKGGSLRLQLRAALTAISTLGKQSASGSDVASTYVTPPNGSK